MKKERFIYENHFTSLLMDQLLYEVLGKAQWLDEDLVLVIVRGPCQLGFLPL